MQFDLDAVGKMLAWLVAKDMPIRHKEQSIIAAEEEAACTGQQSRSSVSVDMGRGQQNGLDGLAWIGVSLWLHDPGEHRARSGNVPFKGGQHMV